MPENTELQDILSALTTGFGTLQAELQLTRKDLVGKIDETNARLEQTNARLEQTNFRLEETNANLTEFKLEMRHTLSGLSTFLLSSERGYRSLEKRVFDLEKWRQDIEHRGETG